MDKAFSHQDFEPMAMLQRQQSLSSERVEAAQAVYEAYDFGSAKIEMRFQSKWSLVFTKDNVPAMMRTISVWPEGKHDAQGLAARFLVEFEKTSADVACAYATTDDGRTRYGHLPDEYAVFSGMTLGRRM